MFECQILELNQYEKGEAMKRIKAYLSIFRIRTAEGFQYRMAGFSGATISIFYALIRISIYHVFYLYANHSGAGIMAGMTLKQLVTYEWLIQTLWVMQAMSIDGEILNKIINGDVGIEMCRPLNIYNHWFAKTAANRMMPLFIRGSLTLLVGFLMPSGYRMSPPASPIALLYALLSCFSAFLLCTAYEMLITGIRLGVTWGEGPTYIFLLVGGVLSGAYLPLQLWPDSMQKFLLLQPFAGYLDIPIRLYIGSVSPEEAVYVIFIQLVWIVILFFLGKKVMERQMNHIIIQGG